MSGRVARRKVTRIDLGSPPALREDRLAVEEPLEIRLAGTSYAVTMRTPGHDVELAAGFLVSEGLVREREHLVGAIHCAADGAENTYNVLDVKLAVPVPSSDRNTYVSSSCGVCGKASIEAVRTTSAFEPGADPVTVDAALLTDLPRVLREHQQVFEQTGGLHAAALFDARTGELLAVREDVGRHNAVDKVVGWALVNEKLPLAGTVLMVSGRASFELVQKAAMAGIPVLAAVSAPSSLAVELAEEAGVTVVGFLRGSSMVVYSRPDRVKVPDE